MQPQATINQLREDAAQLATDAENFERAKQPDKAANRREQIAVLVKLEALVADNDAVKLEGIGALAKLGCVLSPDSRTNFKRNLRNNAWRPPRRTIAHRQYVAIARHCGCIDEMSDSLIDCWSREDMVRIYRRILELRELQASISAGK